MLEGRYKIVFNYVRKQINKKNYTITYNHFGGKSIHFDRVVILSFCLISDVVWYVLPKNKDKHTGYCLTYNCDIGLKNHLEELLEKELKNDR